MFQPRGAVTARFAITSALFSATQSASFNSMSRELAASDDALRSQQFHLETGFRQDRSIAAQTYVHVDPGVSQQARHTRLHPPLGSG